MAENQKQDPNIIINTFVKGINKDAAKYILPPDTYYDAQNVRITAHHGKEGMSMVNVEGNKFLIGIPCAPTVRRIKMLENIFTAPWWFGTIWGPFTFTIIHNNMLYQHTINGAGGNIAAFIYDMIVNSNQWVFPDGSTGVFPTDIINVAYDSSLYELSFWSVDVNLQLQSISLVDNMNNPVGWTQIDSIASSPCDLEVIGYTTIRDDIYIFTTSNDTEAGGNGQIWRLQYDHADLSIVNLTCMMNRDDAMFTKQHPIQAIGRYENNKTQTVYWTDFHNPPRKLNVADDIVSMVVPTRFLDLAPTTGFQIPILQEIQEGGTLPAGTYQYCYRYKSSAGAVSEWSPLSNPVSIYGDLESDPFCNIQGDLIQTDGTVNPENEGNGAMTSKSIRLNLSNLDTEYDFIEFAAIYRQIYRYSSDNVDFSQAYIFKEQENTTSNIDFTHNGAEQKILTTITQITEGIGQTFEKVKTISSKDNKLFVGNVVNTDFKVDFDARAYRFQQVGPFLTSWLQSETDQMIFLDGNTPLAPFFPSFTPWDQVPETHDAINPYNDENPDTNPDWFTTDQFIFQNDGVTLGGSGPNVSYRFITENMVEDTVTPDANQTGVDGRIMGVGGIGYISGEFIMDNNCNRFTPWPTDGSCLVTPGAVNNNVINLFNGGNQTFPMNGTIDNFKSSYKYSLYQGYARGEVYRFGIVFYDKNGKSSFVNWIGDIKFPFEYQTDTGAPLGQFAVHNWNGTGFPGLLAGAGYSFSGTLSTQSIGIEFTVNLQGLNIPAIGITGFSIVRADRDMNRDASKMGQGLLGQVARLIPDPVRLGGECVQNQFVTPFPSLGEANLIPLPCTIQPDANGCVEAVMESVDTGQSDGVNNWFGVGSSDPNNGGVYFTPWNNQFNQGYRVEWTEQKTACIYGPLNWKNSSVEESYNANIINNFKRGDYMKISSVMMPCVNADYANLPVYDMSNYGSMDCGDVSTGQWYKYYWPVTLPAGGGWNLNVGYANGNLDAASQNPTSPNYNIKFDLEYSTWVGDGKIINQSADISLTGNFSNVTNPYDAWSIDCNQGGPFGGAPSCLHAIASVAPRSIGGECTLVTTRNPIPWPDLGMGWGSFGTGGGGGGVHDNANISFGTLTRCIVNYERYTIPYGGPTYAARTRTIYQLCNHYRPINDSAWNLGLLGNLINETWGGDVVTQAFDYVQMEKNFGQAPPFMGSAGAAAMPVFGQGGNCANPCGPGDFLDNASDSFRGIMRGAVVPLEVHTVNPHFRAGYHFAAKGGDGGVYPDNGINLHDEYRYMSGYNAPNNIRSFIALPFNYNLNKEFDTRIYYSDTKINGESADSWARFGVGDYKDVEGIHGPLNNLLTLGNRMMFWQDSGFGILQVNPNAIVQSAEGMQLQLGKVSTGVGAFIQSHEYISTKYGAKQQWAITKSDYSVFFFDALKKKFFSFGGDGNKPLSDVTGMHTWFSDALIGDVLKFDNPIIGKGVTATFDNKHSEALFTFHDKGFMAVYDMQVILVDEIQQGSHGTKLYGGIFRSLDECNSCLWDFDCDVHNLFNPLSIGNLVINGVSYGPLWIVGKLGCPGSPAVPPYQNGDYLFMTYDGTVLDLEAGDIWQMECPNGVRSFTLAYNEFIRGFTSFYDFHPSIYVNDGKYIITPNCQDACYTGNTDFNRDKLYMHDIGNYGQFYEYLVPSSVAVITNTSSIHSKVFDNVSFHMTSLNVDNEPLYSDYDVQNDVFDKVRFSTDYQTSGFVTLTPGDNIKKKEREWQMQVFRNIMSDTPFNNDIFSSINYDPNRQFKDRLRDKYLMTELVYNNFNDVGQAKNIKFILSYFRSYFRGSFR
tara:strand:- start:26620 stop:32097 length:5478 start_codon:yes stop_codon:yes gene_type:complete